MDYTDLNELTRNWFEANARHAWQKKRHVTNVPGIRALPHSSEHKLTQHPEPQQLLPAVRPHTDQRDVWIHNQSLQPMVTLEFMAIEQVLSLVWIRFRYSKRSSSQEAPPGAGRDVEQCWCSTVIAQPSSEELWSPVTCANKELTFKPNYINTAVSC